MSCSKQQEEALSHPQDELIEFITNSLEVWVPLTTFRTTRDPKTRKTAFAQGRSWFSSGLKAWAAPLMPCQKRPPARKPGMSHATGRRNLPIWIEKHIRNSGFFSPLCHLHFCTAILGNCTLPGRQSGKGKAKIHRRNREGLPSKAFFPKGENLRQGGVKGLRGSPGKSAVEVLGFFLLTCMNSSWHRGLLPSTPAELQAKSSYRFCITSLNIVSSNLS